MHRENNSNDNYKVLGELKKIKIKIKIKIKRGREELIIGNI
jgi:hypothetical protein